MAKGSCERPLMFTSFTVKPTKTQFTTCVGFLRPTLCHCLRPIPRCGNEQGDGGPAPVSVSG